MAFSLPRSLTHIAHFISTLQPFLHSFFEVLTILFFFFSPPLSILQGQGAITEKLRSLSMHDLTQINEQDGRGGNQLYHFSSHSANPAVRRSQSTDAAAEAGACTRSQTQTNTDWGCNSPVLCPSMSCFRGTLILGTVRFAGVIAPLLSDIAPSDNSQHHFPFHKAIKWQTVFAKLFTLFFGPTSTIYLFHYYTDIESRVCLLTLWGYLGNCTV